MEALSRQPDPNQTIVLVGFMGAGKSSAARVLSKALGTDACDVDSELERRLGTSIADYFDRNGEAAFRAEEERAALELLDRGGIVALGGGAVESEAVRRRLADCMTVWCEVPEDVAWERASNGARPLARDRDAFKELLTRRLPLYRETAKAVVPTVRREVMADAAPWIAALRGTEGIRLAWGLSATGSYPALFGPGATRLLPGAGRRSFAVADSSALEAQQALLPGHAELLPVAGGEASKTLEQAGAVLSWLADAGARRDDRLIAFGGGVIGDLAGFCGAVYQRGVPVVQIPTTLVAQVDSALGGKTGVDLPEAKNYVGAYHQPEAVLADPTALETLPPEEVAAGFAEVIKTGLLAGGEVWEAVKAVDPTSPTTWESPLIYECARFKLSVVAEDERDAGRRAVLNLGHTVGHAIEQATAYRRYRHGEAVGLGLLAALRLSGADGLRTEVGGLLAAAGLPVSLDPGVDLDAVQRAVAKDKKATVDGVGFVLLERVGEPRPGQLVEASSVRAAVEELR